MKTVALGDHAEFIRGITFKPADVVQPGTHDSVGCMRTKNVQTQLDLDDVLSIPSEFVKREEQYLQAGDVLISSANSWNLLGKCCWVPDLAYRSTFGGFVTALRPADESLLDRRYLYRWFSYGRTQQLLRSFGRKTTNISNLPLDRCRKMEIPLPPIEEQRRIAAVLDAADDLRTKRRQALAKLDTLTQAIFIDMFGDPVTNSKSFSSSEVLNDIADVTSGITKGRRINSTDLEEVPYLAVVNVQADEIVLDPLKTIEASGTEIAKYALVAGDLLLTEGGDPDKLGRGAVWAGQVDPCIHQNHVFRVRVHDEQFEPEFVSKLIASERGKRYFLKMAKQTTGIASINMTQLRRFPLIRPSHDLQLAFIRRIDEIKRQLREAEASAKKLDELFGSLQQRAFAGEL